MEQTVAVSENDSSWRTRWREGDGAVLNAEEVALAKKLEANGWVRSESQQEKTAASEPAQKLGVWKIALGVFAGNLLTAILGAIVYSIVK